MGNHRFKLSDMMPNAWFYKLKEMGKPKSQTTSQHKSRKHSTTLPPPPPSHYKYQHPSYYFPIQDKYPNSPVHHPQASDTHFPDAPPRKSKRKSRRRTPRKSTSSSSSSKLVTSSISSGCNCHATISSAWKPDSPPTEGPPGNPLPLLLLPSSLLPPSLLAATAMPPSLPLGSLTHLPPTTLPPLTPLRLFQPRLNPSTAVSLPGRALVAVESLLR